MTPPQAPAEACPVLLIGLGKIGFSILRLLYDLGEPVVVITRDAPADWERRADRMASRLILADGRSDEALLDAGVRQAKAVIIATNDDLANLEIVLDVHRLSPGVPVVVRMLDHELAEQVARDLPVRAALNPADIAAPAFVAAALGSSSLRVFNVEGSTVQICGTAPVQDEDASLRSVEEIAGGNPVLAIRHGDGEFQLFPDLDAPLAQGDVVVCAQGTSTELAWESSNDEGTTAKRLGSARRAEFDYLPGLRAIEPANRPVYQWLVAGIAALYVISIFVFRVGLGLGWVDAFYFTTTIITTVGFGDIHLIHAPVWVKLYGCLLMLSGVSLLLLLYGMVVDRLVKLRVEQALGTYRPPLRGHVIVAGAGDLGARVATQLHALGLPLLAVEREEASLTALSLPAEVALLRGDAASRSTLERASIESARTVLAMTDDDIANLRIARLAQSLNPRIRTVVRLFQSRLAEKLSSSLLGADVPINPSEAVAATFVAHALAPNVVQGFTLGSHLLLLRKVREPGGATVAPGSVVDAKRPEHCFVRMRREAGSTDFKPVVVGGEFRSDDTVIVLQEYVP